MGKYFLERKASLERKKGFSLIEVSVAIVVVAGATVGLLSWTQPPASTNALKAIETQAKLQEVQKAIEAFRVKKKRLPCPSDPLMRSDGTRSSVGTNYLTPTGASNDYYVNDFGTEDLDTTQTIINGTTTLGIDCAVSVGALPVFSLGLNETYINDAWGRRFTYHVAPSLCGADTGVPGSPNATQIAESESIGCTDKDYKNKTGNITVTTKTPATKLTTVASYVVVSHGSNGKGAFLPSGSKLADAGGSLADTTGNELENSNGDAIYVKTDQRTDPSSTFDDIVVFATKNQVESLTNRKNIKHISVADCEANSQAIKNITLLETGFMDTQLGGYKQITSQATKNTGDQALLGIMKSLQSMCVAYYGAAAATINGQTWSGAQCPGNNNPALYGSTYNAVTDSCSCPNGLWGGSCKIPAYYLAVGHSNSSPYMVVYNQSSWGVVGQNFLPSNGYGVAFSPDGTMMAVGTQGSNPRLIIYKTSDWTVKLNINPPAIVANITFSPDSTIVAAAQSGSPAVLYNTTTGAQLNSPPNALPWANAVAFSPDGTKFAIGGNDSPYLVTYSVSGGDPAVWTKLANPASLPTAIVNDVAYSPDGTKLAVATEDSSGPWDPTCADPNACKNGVIYNTATSPYTKITDLRTIQYGWGWGIAFSPDGTKVAMAHNYDVWYGVPNTSAVTVYSTTTWLPVGSSPIKAAHGRSVAFSKDGTYMAVGYDVSGGASVSVYRTSDWSAVDTSSFHFSDSSESVAFSPLVP